MRSIIAKKRRHKRKKSEAALIATKIRRNVRPINKRASVTSWSDDSVICIRVKLFEPSPVATRVIDEYTKVLLSHLSEEIEKVITISIDVVFSASINSAWYYLRNNFAGFKKFPVRYMYIEEPGTEFVEEQNMSIEKAMNMVLKGDLGSFWKIKEGALVAFQDWRNTDPTVLIISHPCKVESITQGRGGDSVRLLSLVDRKSQIECNENDLWYVQEV